MTLKHYMSVLAFALVLSFAMPAVADNLFERCMTRVDKNYNQCMARADGDAIRETTCANVRRADQQICRNELQERRRREDARRDEERERD